jgi:hypothetical protein
MSIADKLTIIAENEQKVFDAGYEKGKAEGGGGDVDAAFEEGRQAEKKEFWNNIQDYGKRTNHHSAFLGNGCWINVFYPIHDIKPTNLQQCFSLWGDTATENGVTTINLKQRLIDCGVVLDTSNCTRFTDCFYFAVGITHLPKIDMSKTEHTTYGNRVFAYMRGLESIDELVLPTNSTVAPSHWFDDCKKLVDLKLTGTIFSNGFDIHWSTKLSKASILSILNACNIDVTSSPVTITLPSMCIDGATDTEALLESLGGDYETTIYTYGASTIQLPHTNIKPNSVSLIPVDENGNQTNANWIDDGNGNIINPYYPEDQQVVGTINYATGLIDISNWGTFEDLNKYTKCQYMSDSAYELALSKGYNIAFA